MAGMNYNYDESASSWPYFVLTILIVAFVPTLYSYISGLSSSLSSPSSAQFAKNGAIQISLSHKTPIDDDLHQYEQKRTRSKIFNKKFLVLLGLSISIVGLFIFSQSIAPADFSMAFDPFEILGISSSATDREIKSHYRKLSLVYHPDKIARDSTEEQKAELETKFVLINKAYKALTDELTKQNYEKYGHPDGPQDVTHGIALPIWFVEGSYSWILMVFYVIGIAVVLPYSVGKWWSSVQSYTKKGIHVGTARIFTNRLVNHNPANIVTIDSILKLCSQAVEYELLFNGEKSSDDVYSLLVSYINRDFTGSKQNVDVLKAVAIVPKLLDGLIEIAATFRNTELVLKAIETNKCIIQAINPSSTKYYQLLQLPHVDLAKIDSSFEIYTIPKFLNLTTEDQLKFLNVDTLQLQDIIEVASKIPFIKLIQSEFKVPGEDVVPPSSHSHLSMKVLIKSALNKHPIVIHKNELIEKNDLESLRDPFKLVQEQPIVPPSFAPYFPETNSTYNGWLCSLIVQRDNKLSDQPQHFQNISFANLSHLENGELSVGTLKMLLTSTTPPEIGEFQFRCVLKSLDYFGNDLEFPIVMKVEDPPELDERDHYEIENPDEDSVAGVMAALKGEAVNKNDDDEEYSSDDDESDDEDEESDFSDINTDTEDEEEDSK